MLEIIECARPLAAEPLRNMRASKALLLQITSALTSLRVGNPLFREYHRQLGNNLRFIYVPGYLRMADYSSAWMIAQRSALNGIPRHWGVFQDRSFLDEQPTWMGAWLFAMTDRASQSRHVYLEAGLGCGKLDLVDGLAPQSLYGTMTILFPVVLRCQASVTQLKCISSMSILSFRS
jgi:hypothetical protein